MKEKKKINTIQITRINKMQWSKNMIETQNDNFSKNPSNYGEVVLVKINAARYWNFWDII